MAFKFQSGTFLTPSAVNYNSFIPTSFLPTGGLIWGAAQNFFTSDDSNLGSDLRLSFGAFVGKNQVALSCFSDDNQPTNSLCDRRHTNTSVVSLLVDQNTVGESGVIQSIVSTGVNINWTLLNTTGYYNYLLFGGEDILNAQLYSFSSPVTAGVVNYSDVGFKPDVGIFFTVDLSGGFNRTAADAAFCLGFTDGIRQGCTSFFSNDISTTSETASQQSFGNIIVTINDGPGGSGKPETDTSLRAIFNGFTSGGFDLNWTKIQSNARNCWALLLKGGVYQVASGIQPAADGNNGILTNFHSKGILGTSFGFIPGTGIRGGVNFSLGAASGNENHGILVSDENAVGLTRARRIQTQDLIHLRGDDTTFYGQGDIIDVSQTGVNLNWNINEAQAASRQYILLFFGAGTGVSLFPAIFQIGRLVVQTC